MKLNNKRILITGASSGIGLALVKQLLPIPGVQIVGVARNIKTLEEMRASHLHPMSYDVADSGNIETMLDGAIREMGDIDIVIACAGFGYYEKFEDKDYGHIKRIYETNVLSPLYTLEKFLQKTIGKVSFVIVSSALGKFGLPGYALYCSSKYALDGFYDAFRFEQHHRLHCMAVYPVGVETNFWERIDVDMPLPRPLQKAEMTAKAIIRGLRKEKRRVYTSKVFFFLWGLNRISPFCIYLYQKRQQLLFFRWLRKKRGQ